MHPIGARNERYRSE